MYLAAVKDGDAIGASGIGDVWDVAARWDAVPYSQLSHHGQACCDIARDWLVSMDGAQLNGGDPTGGPRWLAHRYKWGPSAWPLHWCEAVGSKVVDCGAHAALAQQAFEARGVASFRAQFVQEYNAHAAGQWRRKWKDEKASPYWIEDQVIYHEGNAVLLGEEDVKLWDPSAGWWYNPRRSGGYGTLVAVRIFDNGTFGGAAFRWGEHRIKPGVWHRLDR